MAWIDTADFRGRKKNVPVHWPASCIFYRNIWNLKKKMLTSAFSYNIMYQYDKREKVSIPAPEIDLLNKITVLSALFKEENQ